MHIRIKHYLLLILLFLSLIPLFGTETTRPYLRSGNWYPQGKKLLELKVKKLLKEAGTKNRDKNIVGIISPHAGIEWSGSCAASVYASLDVENIDKVFMLGVSHRGAFGGGLCSAFEYYATPLGRIKIDKTITKRLLFHRDFSTNINLEIYEHSIENQLPFVQIIFGKKRYRIIPILFGRLQKSNFTRLAKLISKFVDEKSLIIASSDFTHYGKSYRYLPFRKKISLNIRLLDFGILKYITDLNFNGYLNFYKKTGITMCGISPVGILINILKGNRVKGKVVNYYRSGDKTGDFSMSVSYASILFFTEPDEKNQKSLTIIEKKTLLKIARDAVSSYCRGKNIRGSKNKFKITKNLRNVRGVFVTLKKKGRLRGCIGTLKGSLPLYESVSEMAVSSASRDPRFRPVTSRELKNLSFEISVMTPLKPIKDFRMIRLGVDGVVIKRGMFSAVYLPQVATETGWSLNKFLQNLCMKAGLKKNAYKLPGTRFYIFQAEIFGEKGVKH